MAKIPGSRKRMFCPCVSSAAVAAGLLALVPCAQGQYSIQEFGSFGGTAGSTPSGLNASGEVTGGAYSLSGPTSQAFLFNGTTTTAIGPINGVGDAINASGEVAGTVFLPNFAESAFVYNGSTATDLGTLGGNETASVAINASGQVAGNSELASGYTHAFLYNGTMQDLGALGGPNSNSNAEAMNDGGEVVGFSDTSTNSLNQHAFLYNGSSLIDLGTLGGANSSALAINDAGQVTGNAQLGNGDTHAFLDSGGNMIDLGALSGGYSDGIAINASGEVAGFSSLSDGSEDAFLYNGTQMIDLGNLSGSSFGIAGATDLNDSGEVVGYAFVDNGSQMDGWVYENGQMTDLNAFLPANSGITLNEALAVNDAGQIVAFGWDSNIGADETFLLTPSVPDKAPTAVLLLGAVLALALASARSRTASGQS